MILEVAPDMTPNAKSEKIPFCCLPEDVDTSSEDAILYHGRVTSQSHPTLRQYFS